MRYTIPKIHIGLRTIKTVLAVILSMTAVEALGTTDSKLIFAMLGAMAAVQPTFKESLESCLSQIIGVIFGALCGVLLLLCHMPSLVSIAIGIILVITLYNVLQIRYSPSLPCFIVVLICTTADIQPFTYAIGRIWDTAIGLFIGMLINMLVFPYDNSQQIRTTAYTLEKELIIFIEELFDGDDVLPDVKRMRKEILSLERQLKLFSNQRLLLNRKRQNKEITIFTACEEKAQALITHMEVLCAMERPGRLNGDNRRRLTACGAQIRDTRSLDSVMERDVVTNYHVEQLITLRRELLDALRK